MGEQVVKKNCLGTITAISAEQITVRAYDLDDGQYTEKTYLLNRNPTLKNIGSLQELKIGDNVNIEYYIKEQKNILAGIYVEKTPNQNGQTNSGSDIMEEYTPEEMNLPETAHKKE